MVVPCTCDYLSMLGLKLIHFSKRGHWAVKDLYFVCAIITVTSEWAARWRLISLVSQLFAQLFVQAQIKGNIKAPRHWPMWGESISDRWIPLIKGKLCGKCSHLVMSSWVSYHFIKSLPFFWQTMKPLILLCNIHNSLKTLMTLNGSLHNCIHFRGGSYHISIHKFCKFLKGHLYLVAH